MSDNPSNPVVLVTGASGFVGRKLCAVLVERGWTFDVVSRTGSVVGARNTYPSLADARGRLEGVEIVFHLAGLAHAAATQAGKAELMRVNAEETTQLYANAGDAGVGLFIWLSSIKVLGDSTSAPWAADSPLDPQDGYARSKARAEQELAMLAPHNRTSLAIVRPPLVYGPGVKANFLNLMKLAHRRIHLPFGQANAQRAWLSVSNLVDFLLHLACARLDGHSIWHVRDEEETSVAQMLAQLREHLGQPNKMLSVNPKLALGVGRMLGLGSRAERLFLPQRIDASAARHCLGWRPPQTQTDAIAETVRWYLTQS